MRFLYMPLATKSSLGSHMHDLPVLKKLRSQLWLWIRSVPGHSENDSSNPANAQIFRSFSRNLDSFKLIEKQNITPKLQLLWLMVCLWSKNIFNKNYNRQKCEEYSIKKTDPVAPICCHQVSYHWHIIKSWECEIFLIS